MDVLDTLEKLRENIDSTTVVTLTARRIWSSTIQEVVDHLEAGDEDDEDDEEDDDDEHETEGDSYLSPKASWQVAHALGMPQWKVDEDHEAAILELCERMGRRSR